MSYSAAIVGAGLMGRWHAHTARRIGVNVAAIVDPDDRKRQEISSVAGAPLEFDHLSGLFSTRTVDAVHICTPLSTHFELCKQVLESGADVLCEKPLARNKQEADDLMSTALKHKRRLWVVHQFPWQKGATRALRSLDKVGELTRASFLFCSAGGEGQCDRVLDEIVADILPHPLSILPCLSFESEFSDLRWAVERSRAGELIATTSLEDVAISIEISLSARPTECKMVLRGSTGSWHTDFYHGFSWFEHGRVSRFQKIVAPFRRSGLVTLRAGTNLVSRFTRREFAYPGLDRLMRAFYFDRATNDAHKDKQHIVEIASARDAIIDHFMGA